MGVFYEKIFQIIKVALLASALVLTGCSFNPGGNGENGGNGGNGGVTKQVLKFSPSDASALGLVDKNDVNASVRSARSAETDAMIVKILADGTMESFMNLPENASGSLSDISYIAQSPNPDAHEIYIVFTGSSWINYDDPDTGWNSITIGQLLCVYEDGSYDDILMQEDGTWKWLYGSNQDSIAFDNIGNMYYLFQENSGNSWTNMIYKYDPKTKTSTQLTTAVENTYYDKFQVSGDGNWLFAKANMWSSNSSTSYLRAIPVNNPDAPVDLYYNSGTGGWVSDWIYDDDTKSIYYNLNGTLYSIPEKDGKFSKDNRETLFVGDSGSWFNYNDCSEDALFTCSNSNSSYDYRAQEDDGWKSGTGYFDVDGTFKNEEVQSFMDYYYFRNPLTAEQELDFSEILRYFVNKASDSIEDSEVQGKIYKRADGSYYYQTNLLEKYDIRFDIFAEEPGFEMLATVTAGKCNKDALIAISDNGLNSLLYDLLNSDNSSSPYRKSGAGFYEMYDRNFYADVLYLKGSDTKISTDLVRKDRANSTKYDLSGPYAWWIFTWVSSNGSNYTWNSKYTKETIETSGTSSVTKTVVDAEKVLKKMSSYLNTRDFDFKLTAFENDPKYKSLYTDKTNEEAIEFLDNPARMRLMFQYMDDNWNSSNGHAKFLHVTCFKKDTNESAYAWKDNDANSIYWGNVTNFTTSYKKSLYGSYGNDIVEIIDQDGNKKGEYLAVSNDLELNVVQTLVGENGFYFKNALMDSWGEESGTHDLYYYDVINKKMINLFEGKPECKDIEVLSFSVGGNNLYFSAREGQTIKTCKIDTNTYAFELLGSGKKLTQIIVVK